MTKPKDMLHNAGISAKAAAKAPGPVKPAESMTMSGGYTTIKQAGWTQPGAKTGIKSGPVGQATFTPGMTRTKVKP